MTAGFLSPVHPNITGKNAVTVPVPPAMSRNSATDAAHAKIFPARKIAAMPMRALTITKSVRIKIRGIFTERITKKKNCITRFIIGCAVLFFVVFCFSIRSKLFFPQMQIRNVGFFLWGFLLRSVLYRILYPQSASAHSEPFLPDSFLFAVFVP